MASTTKRPGVWELRLYAGVDPVTGREIRLSRSVRGSKTEAKRRLTALLDEIDDGKHSATAGTVGFLLDDFIARCERLGRSPQTIHGYRNKIDVHIKPALGDIPLHRLTARDLDRFYGTLKDSGRAASTIRQHHAIIRAALEHARRMECVDPNVAELATPPSATGARLHGLPTPAQARDLLEAVEADSPDMAVLVWLAATAGARRGELCALRWRDVDLDAGAMTIAHSVIDLPGRVEVRGTKTHQARRLALDPATVAVSASTGPARRSRPPPRSARSATPGSSRRGRRTPPTRSGPAGSPTPSSGPGRRSASRTPDSTTSATSSPPPASPPASTCGRSPAASGTAGGPSRSGCTPTSSRPPTERRPTSSASSSPRLGPRSGALGRGAGVNPD